MVTSHFSNSQRAAAFGLFITLVAILSSTLTATLARAYNLSGYHWAYISNVSECVNAVGNEGAGYSNALGDWFYGTGGYFDYYQYCPTPEMRFMSTYNMGAMWDGHTTYTVSGTLLTHTDSYVNTYYTQYMSAQEVQSTTAHEIGHALGLGDVSGGAEVMNNCTCCANYSRFCYYTIFGPQTDDINGFNAIY